MESFVHVCCNKDGVIVMIKRFDCCEENFVSVIKEEFVVVVIKTL